MKVLLAIWRCIFWAMMLGVGVAFYQDSQEHVDAVYRGSPHWEALRPLWLAVIVIDLVVQWRRRKSNAEKEPSPARSAVGVVVATGAAALIYTGHHAYQTGDYFVPVAILLATIGLAFPAYWFATKHAGQIGEARFDTTSRPG